MTKFNFAFTTNSDTHSATIKIPLSEPNEIKEEKTIYEAEVEYIQKRDEQILNTKKAEYDMARAVLKAASTCGATLVSQDIMYGTLTLTLHFATLAELDYFEANAISMIMGSAMTREDFEKIK